MVNDSLYLKSVCARRSGVAAWGSVTAGVCSLLMLDPWEISRSTYAHVNPRTRVPSILSQQSLIYQTAMITGQASFSHYREKIVAS